MADSFSKREREKQKQKAREEKAEKKKERKEGSGKKSLNEMMAYIDENGNLSSTPPDPSKMKTINAEDISLEVSRPREQEDPIRTGVVTHFNAQKGYGFITDSKNNESIFVHANNAEQPLQERDKVSFEIERTQRGLSAINVKKL